MQNMYVILPDFIFKSSWPQPLNPPKTSVFVGDPLAVVLVHVFGRVLDDLLISKEKNKKMEEEMEAAFQDIQNM